MWVILGPYVSGGNHLTNGRATINVPPGAIGSAGTDYISINVDGDDNYMPSSGGAPLNHHPVGSFTFGAPTITVSLAHHRQLHRGYDHAVRRLHGVHISGADDHVSPTNAQHLPALSLGTTPTVTFTGSSPITVTLYVFTTAPTQAAIGIPHHPGGRAYATGGATLACILFLWVPRRHRNLRNVLGAIVLLMFLMTGVLACGGGSTSNTSGSGNTGTTPGSYTITITGTSGPITASGMVNLTVR